MSAPPAFDPAFDPTSDDQLADPYPRYAQMRARCPVLHDRDRDIWVLTRHEDVARVVHDPGTFSSESAVRISGGPESEEVQQVLAEGWSLTPNLTESDGEEHTRLRVAVNRVFTPRRVAALEPFVRDTAEDLIARFAADGHTDIIESYAWPLPLIVMAKILGVPPRDVPLLRRWSSNWLKLSVGTGEPAERVEWARDVVTMQHYVMSLLDDTDRADPDSLISSLARYGLEHRLEHVELMRIVMNLIIAGHVTVTRAIGNGLLTLLEHPDQLEALRTGEASAETMVEETLRFESPVQGLFRTVTRPTELGGRHLAPGDRVMVHWGSANRDADVFDDPDAFDLRSRPGRHQMAFGRGVHACLGAALARLQLRIAIPLLFDRLPALRPGPAGSRTRERLVIARGFEELHLHWDAPEPAKGPPMTAPVPGPRRADGPPGPA
ncbi:cytochrome P450 [Streptomyces asoensis]|uniref:Cytochrome P450 n=1 Tax=Streptomyces asoensis TaxID=249586 RepID=A0ABQ3SCS1_9ACTN|nr:cytochrome P450 [Streptomyces asoensis]GGQ91316.1 cytochrome P450 [Streptomyces asoensis]GHI65930.1 cytochrome P450 [Streptomyces asoensis]